MNSTGKPCRDICMSHSARTDRDYRICPSKLSKRELEDLYYNLLDSNLNLKQTINVLQDKLKILSTKLQRLTEVQRSSRRDGNDCCSRGKALHEQNETLTELKRINANLIEKNRLLNMKLCSAKQFLRRSPSRPRISNTNFLSMKNSSLSALNTKRSEHNLRLAPHSPQTIEKPDISESAVDAEDHTPKQDNNVHNVPEKLCDENKCKTLVEELKQKIIDLEQELASANEDYSYSISRLKHEVKELQDENIRIAGDKAADEISLHRREEEVEGLKLRLREAEAKNCEIAMQLSIEKRKVAELETRLKSEDLSNQVARTIGEHLNKINETRKDTIKQTTHTTVDLEWDGSSPLRVPVISMKRLSAGESLNSSAVAKSDDSGYAEANKTTLDEDKTLNKLNKELLNKIVDLQAQVDVLKIAAAANSPEKKSVDIQCNEGKLISEDSFVAFRQNTYEADDDTHTKSSKLQSLERDNDTEKLTGSNKMLSGEVPNSVEVEGLHQNNDVNDVNSTITKNDNVETTQPSTIDECQENTLKIKINKTKKKPSVTCECPIENIEKSKETAIQKNENKKIQNDVINNKGIEELKGKEIEAKARKSKKKCLKQVCQCPPRDVKLPCRCPKVRKSNKFIAENNRTEMVGDKTGGEKAGVTGSGVEQEARASPDSSRTYTVDGACTDCEISYMSDLPSERDGNQYLLSPGEERGTAYSESYTMTTDYGSLSVGEVPGGRTRKLSVGEKNIKHNATNTQNIPTSSERVEDALRLITEELSRCRRMLLAKRPTEVMY